MYLTEIEGASIPIHAVVQKQSTGDDDDDAFQALLLRKEEEVVVEEVVVMVETPGQISPGCSTYTTIYANQRGGGGESPVSSLLRTRGCLFLARAP